MARPPYMDADRSARRRASFYTIDIGARSPNYEISGHYFPSGFVSIGLPFNRFSMASVDDGFVFSRLSTENKHELVHKMQFSEIVMCGTYFSM